jgi:hypothetical protein
MRRSITLEELLDRIAEISAHRKAESVTDQEAYRRIVEAFTLIDPAELEHEDDGEIEPDNQEFVK